MATDWQFKPISRHCAVTNTPLRIGDRVVCVVFKPQGADIERADILADNIAQFATNGIELGRWNREVKSRSEEEREARIQLLATREEFFISLFSDPQDPSGDKAVLKQLTALILERKRILRPLGKPAGGVQRYLHVRTRDEYDVPADDLSPEKIARVQNALEVLVG
jgi:hypothetical protein